MDRLFVDESHYYKNLFLFTKMRNVGGIAQTEAMKSSDLFMKCRYLDELTGGRGTVFATGTPISNSMVELYTIQRYLQYNTLVQNNLQHFDAWASTFGETITAVELTPEGTGYRAKTRFARFYNLPELMAMFKEIADIKTADMLDLPVPKAVFHNISVKPSEIQRDMVAGLAERAERVRNGMVDARVDNMLKITNDGRKLALDQRLINPLLPDFEDSKLNACVDAMFETWERGSEKRLTQLFFCDLSTPKNDGSFNVYDDIRQKLIARGVPADEIKFIHEADTEAKKLELFKKVRRGDVRILMGSTQKMGAGIKDSMVAEMTDLNRNLMMSIDVIPVPTDEAVREAESRLLGVETNATNWQRRQNANNNFSAQLPYDIEQQRKEMKEFLDDLTTRDQRMMFAVLTMVHTADTKEQLDNDTEALLTTARKHLCQFGVLKFQQLDGLNTAMPFGVRKIESFRTLTTESLAVFIPFRVQDICHTNGVYYGQNVISKNMIIADRRQLLNGNEFILGVSGGGKSFTAKGEIINQVLAGNADIIIIDPEREYSPLVRALGGEIINISATSPTHINAMDMNREYGDGANPVILKSEFIMSLCEQLIGGNNLGAVQKSIIDRCTASVYRTYQQNNYTGEVPTLQDFRAELLKQSEPEAQEIALAIELFTNGSLNTFAKKTNVDTDNRLICYDILDLGKQLMPIGMLVVLDSILNRITQNRAKGKNTFIFIDEIYLLFQHEYSANFLFTLWKRVRKYGAYATGITQNVDDLLQSHTARTMLANSEFIVMLNQASTDRLELAKLLNISDTQLSYITNVDAGHGLIKVGSSLVPFANKFPKNTKLYKLMTTKPGEGA